MYVSHRIQAPVFGSQCEVDSTKPIEPFRPIATSRMVSQVS